MKIFFIAGALFFLFIHPNKAGSSIETDCESIANQMFENILNELKPEEVEKAKAMKSSMLSGLIKECNSGKYNIDCLKTARSLNLTAFQTCKK